MDTKQLKEYMSRRLMKLMRRLANEQADRGAGIEAVTRLLVQVYKEGRQKVHD